MFNPGDWIIITHKERELCVVGRVAEVGCYPRTPQEVAGDENSPAILIADCVLHHDPEDFDLHKPGWWPLDVVHLRIDKLGPSAPAV